MKKLSSFKEFTGTKKTVSEFDASIKIVTLYQNENFEYEIWKPLFEEHGYAIALLEEKKILVDGDIVLKEQISKDELDFILAHEYSHFRLGENASEAECDWLAIANLWNKGKKNAAKVGVNEFFERHNMEFDTKDLPGYDAWLFEGRQKARTLIYECTEKKIEILKVLKNPKKYRGKLDCLDVITEKQILPHAWDLYVEHITRNTQ